MKHKTEAPQHEKPPFFNTWQQMYAAVISLLVFYMAVLYFFTQYFK